jgi:membrane fusion protein, heavy metal efflux system
MMMQQIDGALKAIVAGAWRCRGVRGLGVLLLACIVVAGALDRLGSGASRADANTPAVERTLVRDGGKIFVPEGSPLRQRLVVHPVDVRLVTERLVLPAVVEADPARTAKVLPALPGRIAEVHVALGDHVRQGQVLAVIDSADLAQALNDAEKARSALSLAKKALDRQRALTAARAGAIKDQEAAEDAFTVAQAESKRAEARLKEIGATDEPRGGSRLLTVRSPTGGTVTDLQAARGTFFNDPTQPLMTISELGTVWVTANVPEKDIAFVKKGQDVDVTLLAYPGELRRGTVLFVSDVLEPDTRRAKVRIAFSNPDGALKPNMFATATFMASERAQLVVPTSSLLMNNDSTTVFVEIAPWTFERRKIDIGYEADKTVSILGGVTSGDRVVVAGGVLLND